MADVLGTAGSDTLVGFDTDDRIYAYGGDDVLFGGLGNDLLDGMTGADTMYGGAGNDRYRIDDAGDVVSEDQNNDGLDDGGTELVESTISYTLGAFLENLTLTGTATIDGTGNGLANKIKGNDAANFLAGAGGHDTLTGGLGADTFVFGRADAASTDQVTDFAADDRLGIFAADYGLSEGNGLTNGQLSDSYFAIVGSGDQATASSAVVGTAVRTLNRSRPGSA